MSGLVVLSRDAARDKYKLASTVPWLLLLDFQWSGEHLRFVRNTDAVTFDAQDGLGPQVYQPLAFELTNATTGSDGSLPQITLKVSNINRMVEGAIVQYDGAVGASCALYVVRYDNGVIGEMDLAMDTTILQTQTSATWVTFTLGATSPLRQLFPKFLYYQDTCMWPYKSTWCGYTGSMPTCDLTLDGANGCIAHANQVRFGGFPGIGSNGASVAGQI